MYYRGRLDETCRVTEVNLTLSVMAISRGFEKFTYYIGFRGIESRTTKVLLYWYPVVMFVASMRSISHDVYNNSSDVIVHYWANTFLLFKFNDFYS
jgi:hypothetical protein